MAPVRVAVIDSGFPRLDVFERTTPVWVDFTGGDREPPVLSGPSPRDEGSHGSRAAATIAILADRDLQLILCRVAAEAAIADVDRDVANAIRFAVSHGADIVYFGWASYEPLPLVDAAIAAARDSVLFIAPAGNSTGDIDRNPVFPAAFDHDNLLVVTHERLLSVGSRDDDVGHGGRSVDAVVQGLQSLGERLGSAMELGDTSGSAAAAAGLAARLKQKHLDFGAVELKSRLLQQVMRPETAEQATNLRSCTVSGGILLLAG